MVTIIRQDLEGVAGASAVFDELAVTRIDNHCLTVRFTVHRTVYLIVCLTVCLFARVFMRLTVYLYNTQLL